MNHARSCSEDAFTSDATSTRGSVLTKHKIGDAGSNARKQYFPAVRRVRILATKGKQASLPLFLPSFKQHDLLNTMSRWSGWLRCMKLQLLGCSGTTMSNGLILTQKSTGLRPQQRDLLR